MNKKGFTLIELLVVIAIIGILASVVLASLKSARDRAANAAIQSDLHTIQTQAALYYDSHNNSYGSFPIYNPPPDPEPCDLVNNDAPASVFGTDSGNVYSIIRSAQALNPSLVPQCGILANAYFVAVNIKATGNPYWCVDSIGNSKQVDSASMSASITAGNVYCP